MQAVQVLEPAAPGCCDVGKTDAAAGYAVEPVLAPPAACWTALGL
jgi:hypothetical protein